MPMLNQRYESSAIIRIPVNQVFEYLDNHARLSSHMQKSSWQMGGGRMEIELDQDQGRKVGSRIRLAGRVRGVELSVEERVTEHTPPHRKVWETIGSPQLLVIGHYRMGFDLSPRGNDSTLRVFIEYALPDQVPARWLGQLLGKYYARWCTQQMVDEAVKHFSSLATVMAH